MLTDKGAGLDAKGCIGAGNLIEASEGVTLRQVLRKEGLQLVEGDEVTPYGC